ncbi:hypothetical protein RFI_29745 [Reticulomyxa filosa]|uniref:WD-40 repeat protein n=1 Tax=Reticulomyxa filosa TaxID=46433 RepID=X6M3P4_RETFI|nr:hypothetical protein RFI_29745 [Reticulomyxa filosa]|eukprot:ETO07645.1 hypothetical protein RFI_29745 [Reticulomyxa filosa]
MYCVKFLSYSSSKYHLHNKQLQIFNGHANGVCGIKFSSFNDSRYYVLDHMITLFVYGMLKHQNHYMFSMDMKMVFGVLIFHHYKAIINDNNNNKMNNISVIDGNGYTICFGSCDNTIQIWDIETTKQFNNNIGNSNVICSGSCDNTIRFWDIRSNKNQLHVIKGDDGNGGIIFFEFFTIKKE